VNSHEGEGTLDLFCPTITQVDARDAVDFAEAILPYVFVLRDRFSALKHRRDQKASSP
jgi:hypothetical protein